MNLKLDLSQFYNDKRKLSLVYLNLDKLTRVADVLSMICTNFIIPDEIFEQVDLVQEFSLFYNEYFIHPGQSSCIFENINGPVRLIRSDDGDSSQCVDSLIQNKSPLDKSSTNLNPCISSMIPRNALSLSHASDERNKRIKKDTSQSRIDSCLEKTSTPYSDNYCHSTSIQDGSSNFNTNMVKRDSLKSPNKLLDSKNSDTLYHCRTDSNMITKTSYPHSYYSKSHLTPSSNNIKCAVENISQRSPRTLLNSNNSEVLSRSRTANGFEMLGQASPSISQLSNNVSTNYNAMVLGAVDDGVTETPQNSIDLSKTEILNCQEKEVDQNGDKTSNSISNTNSFTGFPQPQKRKRKHNKTKKKLKRLNSQNTSERNLYVYNTNNKTKEVNKSERNTNFNRSNFKKEVNLFQSNFNNNERKHKIFDENGHADSFKEKHEKCNGFTFIPDSIKGSKYISQNQSSCSNKSSIAPNTMNEPTPGFNLRVPLQNCNDSYANRNNDTSSDDTMSDSSEMSEIDHSSTNKDSLENNPNNYKNSNVDAKNDGYTSTSSSDSNRNVSAFQDNDVSTINYRNTENYSNKTTDESGLRANFNDKNLNGDNINEGYTSCSSSHSAEKKSLVHANSMTMANTQNSFHQSINSNDTNVHEIFSELIMLEANNQSTSFYFTRNGNTDKINHDFQNFEDNPILASSLPMSFVSRNTTTDYKYKKRLTIPASMQEDEHFHENISKNVPFIQQSPPQEIEYIPESVSRNNPLIQPIPSREVEYFSKNVSEDIRAIQPNPLNESLSGNMITNDKLTRIVDSCRPVLSSDQSGATKMSKNRKNKKVVSSIGSLLKNLKNQSSRPTGSNVNKLSTANKKLKDENSLYDSETRDEIQGHGLHENNSNEQTKHRNGVWFDNNEAVVENYEVNPVDHFSYGVDKRNNNEIFESFVVPSKCSLGSPAFECSQPSRQNLSQNGVPSNTKYNISYESYPEFYDVPKSGDIVAARFPGHDGDTSSQKYRPLRVVSALKNNVTFHFLDEADSMCPNSKMEAEQAKPVTIDWREVLSPRLIFP